VASKELYLSNSNMADEPHQEEGSFTSFWQRSADKISSKAVKFMPNVTKPGSGESSLISPVIFRLLAISYVVFFSS
jgi:hypothetical protein